MLIQSGMLRQEWSGIEVKKTLDTTSHLYVEVHSTDEVGSWYEGNYNGWTNIPAYYLERHFDMSKAWTRDTLSLWVPYFAATEDTLLLISGNSRCHIDRKKYIVRRNQHAVLIEIQWRLSGTDSDNTLEWDQCLHFMFGTWRLLKCRL